MKTLIYTLITCLILTQSALAQSEVARTKAPGDDLNLVLHEQDGAGVAAIGCSDPSKRCDAHLVRGRINDSTRADRNSGRTGSSQTGSEEGSR